MLDLFDDRVGEKPPNLTPEQARAAIDRFNKFLAANPPPTIMISRERAAQLWPSEKSRG